MSTYKKQTRNKEGKVLITILHSLSLILCSYPSLFTLEAPEVFEFTEAVPLYLT
jgi:hypothetical protein